jgi:hypothetical protein
MQVEQMKVASQQLQSAVRRDVLLSELDGKIAFDHVSQLRYFQTHKTGLQGLEILFSGISLNISLEAFSFNIAASISQIYFRIEANKRSLKPEDSGPIDLEPVAEESSELTFRVPDYRFH